MSQVDWKSIIGADRKPRVLGVDDQKDALRLLQIRLQTAGMECVVCGDGASALQKVTEMDFDMIVLDVMMPVMDGFEVCRRIKAGERNTDTPVLFLTAKFDIEDKVRGLDVGGQDYLTKPIEQAELLARSKSAIRVKALQDQLKGRIELQRKINDLHQSMLSEHWQKTLGQLAASLAHEINNPLAAALGSTQLLALEDGLSQNMQDRLQIIDRSLQRAGQKLRSLLLIAQSGRHTQTIALAQLVEDIVTVANFQVVVHKVHVRTDLDHRCVWQGVPSELGRVVLYLINNAIEAVIGVAQPAVQIAVKPNGAENVVSITDNGPGIPESLREKVFEPFFTTKSTPHNGVGLFLAREMLRTGGGRIEVRDGPGGVGTTVSAILPISV